MCCWVNGEREQKQHLVMLSTVKAAIIPLEDHTNMHTLTHKQNLRNTFSVGRKKAFPILLLRDVACCRMYSACVRVHVHAAQGTSKVTDILGKVRIISLEYNARILGLSI